MRVIFSGNGLSGCRPALVMGTSGWGCGMSAIGGCVSSGFCIEGSDTDISGTDGCSKGCSSADGSVAGSGLGGGGGDGE